MDNAASRRPAYGSARQLVSIFQETTIPTQPDRYFAAHPATLGCAETEGDPCPPTIDTSTTMYVDVLNQAAVAGDLLVATAVGGRWVAEKGSSKKNCGCYIPCQTIQIPASDLTLTMAGSVSPCNTARGGIGPSQAYSYSTTLNYFGATGWFSNCLNDGPFASYNCVPNNTGLAKFSLRCVSSTIVLGYAQYCTNGLGNGICPPPPTMGGFLTEASGSGGIGCQAGPMGTGCGGFTAYSLTSLTTSPFKIVYEICNCSVLRQTVGFCPPGGIGAVPPYEFTTITITGPTAPPPPSHFCITVCASACGVPQSGVTVTASDPNTGRVVATGLTTLGGCISLDVGSSGAYTITTSKPGFKGSTITQKFSCPATPVQFCLLPDLAPVVTAVVTLPDPAATQHTIADGVSADFYDDLSVLNVAGGVQLKGQGYVAKASTSLVQTCWTAAGGDGNCGVGPCDCHREFNVLFVLTCGTSATAPFVAQALAYLYPATACPSDGGTILATVGGISGGSFANRCGPLSVIYRVIGGGFVLSCGPLSSSMMVTWST